MLCTVQTWRTSMQITFENSISAAIGLWVTEIPPHQLKMFGDPNRADGTSSVLLVTKPSYNEETERLTVQAEDILVLNVGTTARTLVIDANGAAADGAELQQGPGDRDYRSLVDLHLKGEAREVGHAILTKVRAASTGDLKRGERNNFSNTPDNFWYVIVQPRTQSLSITVRGEPDGFLPSSLALVADRPGYTRFQIRSVDEVEEALRIIQASTRRRFGFPRRVVS
jgi:hypothetical protein